MQENDGERGRLRSGGVMELVWCSDETKLAAQVLLKGDTSQTLQCSTKSVYPMSKINYQLQF